MSAPQTPQSPLVLRQISSKDPGGLRQDLKRELIQNFVSIFSLAIFIWLYTLALLNKNIFTLSIGINLIFSVLGLAIFGVGLQAGLMPLGQLVGAGLPKRVKRRYVMLTIFVLGILCTIAEPAIGALKEAGADTDEKQAPLLANILDSAGSLMLMVGVGVGFAGVAGCLRLVKDVKIKGCLFATCLPAGVLTLICANLGTSLATVTGLAWDCGAVTTGPVTVPIVLALGIGVAGASKSTSERTAARAEDEVDLSGFGIVTFASLFPVLTVWTMAMFLHIVNPAAEDSAHHVPDNESWVDDSNPGATLKAEDLAEVLFATCRAVLPLVGFLLGVQHFLVKEPLPDRDRMIKGLVMTFVGMFVFSFGLNGALTPLGKEAGSALPDAINLWGDTCGAVVILAFGFLSGLIATFSEPALAALGDTVEKLTEGKFSKMKLIFSVAIGVGAGITLGFAKVYFKLDLTIILVVGYTACLILTHFSDEATACVAWDCAGVTTGPVTVPIVLASGLALGRTVKVAEGFGILSCASIGPILSVMIAGLLQKRAASPERKAEDALFRLPMNNGAVEVQDRSFERVQGGPRQQSSAAEIMRQNRAGVSG